MNLKMDIGHKTIVVPPTFANLFIERLNQLMLDCAVKQLSYRKTETFTPFALELKAVDAPSEE